ncbi:MAG: carboxypeptidase-like regulatory domain-containing protein [Burkholderiales bacterium]
MKPRYGLSHILSGAALAAACAGQAGAADIYGRVYDTLQGRLYPGARVSLASNPAQQAVCDDQAQFRFSHVAPGAYLVHVALPDRGLLTSRILVGRDAPTVIANLDIAKINPPEEDDEY